MNKKRAEKLKKEQEFFNTFDWNKTLFDCFDAENVDFKNMKDIINFARSQNRGIKADSKYYNVHHIIPRSYFKKMNFPIDNREINLVKLTLQEHFMVHYYAWKCAKSPIKRSMATAFHLMVGRATKGLQNAPTLSIEQLSELMIPLETKKDKKLIENEKLNYLKEKSKTEFIEFVDETHVKFKCINCNNVVTAYYDKNRTYDLCVSCTTSKLHKGMYFTDRKYPKEGVILCACVSSEYGSFWKLVKYKVSHPYSNIHELRGFCEQCMDNCDKVYIIKIYENKTKEELTEYFNKKFGYKRSYLYLRNVYLKEYIVYYKNKLYYREDCDDKSWYKLKSLARKKEAFAFRRALFDLCVKYQKKDPTFMQRLTDEVNFHIQLNDGKDVKDFLKD